MAVNVFKTTTSEESPLDASAGTEAKPAVSEFLTIQSLTNFATMTGAITAAWRALQTLMPTASTIWVPYVFAFIWAFVSFLISIEGLKTTKKNGSRKLELGTVLGAILIAFINSLVLAGAVIGTNVATSQTP